MEAKTCN